MTARDIIERKREGASLTDREIRFFIRSYMGGEISDYQAAALLMAICIQGMTAAETLALTREMRDSGSKLDLSRVAGLKIDKHSTGGVGDKTSLLLAPIVAACGVNVPMISGRALGHTGGTLDKLQSIPGFDPRLKTSRVTSLLKRHGAVLLGQSRDLAPADGRLYALRDATGTVESIPLITASILSKKLAEDIDGLVLDVKTGLGALMPSLRLSLKLARSLVNICGRLGTKVVAVLTRMDQPLGRAVGNALEVRECLEYFDGNSPNDLDTVTMALASRMIVLGRRAKTLIAAERMARETISSGEARRRFLKIVAAQGGDVLTLESPELLPRAGHIAFLRARQSGFVRRADARRIGNACNELGAGRARMDDFIDPAVGIYLRKKVADRVERGEILCDIHWNDPQRLRAARAILEKAFEIGDRRVRQPGVIHSVLQG